MKIQPYINRLRSSPEYKEFQQKYKDAFLVAGFFVIDFETGKNLHQIDYYVPSKKKFAAFTLDKNIQFQLLNSFDKRTPKEMNVDTKIDLDALNGIIQDEMKNRNITQSIKKMIAVVQNLNGKNVWNVNCILSGMDILKVHVDDNSETILKMEKTSLMDYMKKISLPFEEAKPSKEEIEKQIEQLDKLKDVLKKEKIEIEKTESRENSTIKKSSIKFNHKTKKK